MNREAVTNAILSLDPGTRFCGSREKKAGEVKLIIQPDDGVIPIVGHQEREEDARHVIFDSIEARSTASRRAGVTSAR